MPTNTDKQKSNVWKAERNISCTRGFVEDEQKLFVELPMQYSFHFKYTHVNNEIRYFLTADIIKCHFFTCSVHFVHLRFFLLSNVQCLLTDTHNIKR